MTHATDKEDHVASRDGPLLPRLAPLLVAMFLGFLTVSLPLAALPLHVTGTLGFGTAMAGLAVGIQSLATILTRPSAGRLVDSRGAKPTLLLGLMTSAVAGALYVTSTMPWLGHGVALAVLLLGRLTLGAGESLLITGIVSWGMMRAGPGRAGAAMSWNGMAQYGALAVGAPLGFALYQTHGFGVLAGATALLPLLAVLVVLPLEGAAPMNGARVPLRGVVQGVWRPGVALMLSGIGFASVSTFASLDFAERGWPGAGWALSAFGTCFVAVRAVAGNQPDRLGGVVVATACLAVETAGQILLWSAPHPAVALLGAALTGAGCSLVFPALGVLALRGFPPEARGIAFGAFAAFQDAAIGLTGPVLGLLAAATRPASVFLVGALAAAAGLAAVLRLRR